MFFRKNKGNHVKKIDKLVTTFIIGWAVAWIIGLSKIKKWKKVTKSLEKEPKNILKKAHGAFWKMIVRVLDFFNTK
jgi:hypothetical protein